MNLTQDELQTLINLVDARLERQYNEEYQTILDKLTSENDVFDEMVADAEEALANEPEINGVKSLNFR